MPFAVLVKNKYSLASLKVAAPRAEEGETGDLVDAFPAGGARARENDLSDELWLFLCDHLRDEAAEGEPKQIDLIEAQGADEGDGVPRHRGD